MPEHILSISDFGLNWRIRGTFQGKPILQPTSVYRYMHQKYVDQFFEEGLLQLSSFESNRTIEDAIRQDKREGTGAIFVVSRDRQRVQPLMARAFDHRMLCLSSSAETDRLMEHFKVDGCFEVKNTTGFGYEVAKTLNHFQFGLEGVVTYQTDYQRYLLLEQHEELPDLMVADPPNDVLFKYLDFIGRTNQDMLYTKPVEFAHESEYRFTWRCTSENPILIKCPEAVKYCRRIT